jgi:GWxTD domain-containing protein
VYGYFALLKIASRSQRIPFPANLVTTTKPSALYECELVLVPVTAGLRRAFILLPMNWRAWDEWKLRAVLTHEIAHIRRWDNAVLLVASINRCLFWFNPVAWRLERQLASLAEQASDEAAVFVLRDAPRYAELLVEFATAVQGRQRIGILAMARPQIRSRVDRILSMHPSGNGMATKATWATLCVVVAVALYAACAAYAAPQSRAAVYSLVTWVDQVASIITDQERSVYQGLRTDEERNHFIEQFWARRFPTWLDEVAYIIRDDEREFFIRLRTDEERQHFIQQFWQRMDPSPSTPENEFKEEYFRRLQFGSQRYKEATAVSWWRTDRGRIYIIYGEPDEIRSYSDGAIRISRQGIASYPFEHWRYSRKAGDGSELDFTFGDLAKTGEYRLAGPIIRPLENGVSNGAVIDQVIMRGNRRVPADVIRKALLVKAGDRFSVGAINGDIQSVYALGQFEDVSAEITGAASGGLIVNIDVREKP